jgi:uncharacterized protein YidB (DUF937 family)
MNKILLGIAVVAVLAVAFGSAGYVYAQSPTPGTPDSGYGYGMGGGRGGRGGGMMGGRAAGAEEGILHDAMVAAFAEKLDMTAADLEARLDAGETMAQVADSKGISSADFITMMTEARAQAVDQAVKDGTLTQEQADWMKQRGAGMGNGRGMGQGQFQHEDCPYAQDNS